MSSIRRFIKAVLSEGKVQDLEHKYVIQNPVMDSHTFKQLVTFDPSPTKKYLEWMIKQVAKFSEDSGMITMTSFLSDLKSTIEYFHNNIHKFQQKDINQYKSLDHLENKVKEIEEVESTKNAQKLSGSNAKKLYEDQRFLVIRPDDKEAVMKYGAGTKWCITMKNANYYEDYVNSGAVFYFLIDKLADASNSGGWEKVAIAITRSRDENGDDNNIENFDALDNQIEDSDIIDNFGRWPATRDDNIERKIKKFIDLAHIDSRTAPESFMLRLRRRKVSEREIIEYWKNNFDNTNSEKINAKKKNFCASIHYASQVKIAEFDFFMHKIIKSGGYVNNMQSVRYPCDGHGYFIRTKDNKIFIERDQVQDGYYEVEAFDLSGESAVIHENEVIDPEVADDTRIDLESLTKSQFDYVDGDRFNNHEVNKYTWSNKKIPLPEHLKKLD